MNKSLKKWFHAAAMAALAACVDGDSPTGVVIPRPVSISALPSFAITPTLEELAVLDSSRVTLRDVDNGSIVADTVFAVDPSVEEWVFDLKIDLAAGQVLSLSLTVELFDIHVDPQSVEWSGRTEEPFDVQASFEPKMIHMIRLHRGPLVNLDLQSLTVSGAPQRLQEGGSAVLRVDTVGAAAGQIIYFGSDDPQIASVDGFGNIRALVPGETRIIAFGGRVADTLDLTVGQVNLPSTQVLLATVMPQVDYVTGDLFMSTLADQAAALAIKDALGALSTEMLAGRGFESVGKFEDAAEVWDLYGKDSTLRLLDGPQLGVIALALIRAADVLEIDFLEER